MAAKFLKNFWVILCILNLGYTEARAKTGDKSTDQAKITPDMGCLSALDESAENIALFKTLGDFVSKNLSFPTVFELASAAKTDASSVTKWLGVDLVKLTEPARVEAQLKIMRLTWEKFPVLKKDLKLKLAKQAARYLSDRLKLPTPDRLSAETTIPVWLTKELYGYKGAAYSVYFRALMADIRALEKNPIESVRNDLIHEYVKWARKNSTTPTEREFASFINVADEDLKYLFGKDQLFTSFKDLETTALRQRENSLLNVIHRELFSPERQEKLNQDLLKKTSFLVTTAVANHRLDQEFFQAAVKWAKENDGAILVFPANLQTTGLPYELLNHPLVHILVNNVDLGPEYQLNTIDILAKALRPQTGLKNLGKELGKSIIAGSTQIYHDFQPVTKGEYRTQELMLTGAITVPDYSAKLIVSKRTSTLAKLNHQIGGVILEKTSRSNQLFPVNNVSGRFHARHVAFNTKRNGFSHDGKFYGSAKAPKNKVKIDAVISGDWHIGMHNNEAMEALKRNMRKNPPRVLIVHDLFNGHSISNHESKNLSSLERRARQGTLSLKSELTWVVNKLDEFLYEFPELKIVVVKANHNEWITRYINDARFIGDPENMQVARILWSYLEQGVEPLEALRRGLLEADALTGKLKDLGVPKVSDPDRVIVLRRNQSFMVGDLEDPLHQWDVAQHFDQGANGARASPNTFALAMQNSVGAHTHVPMRYKNYINVGTMTNLDGGYTGPISSWMHGFATIDGYGNAQLHIVRDGVVGYKDAQIVAGTPIDPKSGFYPPGFPKVEKTDHFAHEDVDQYSSYVQEKENRKNR